MRIRNAVIGCGVFTVVLTMATQGFGQAAGLFKIKNIRQQLLAAPNIKGAVTGTGASGSSLQKKWLEIECEFESAPDWADDVQLKFYVLLVGKDKEPKMFGGELTLVNVEKGRGHLSAMYMHPNTVLRYGRGGVEAVHVELWYKGQRADMETLPLPRTRWWEGSEATKGFLLNSQQTPWASVAYERFEALKPSSRSD